MKLFLIIISCFCLKLQAQKQVEKQLDASAIEQVSINGNGVFKLKIRTSKSPNIGIKAYFDGEYNEQVLLVTKQDNTTLVISTQLNPLFEPDNDKLSAHKVISIELEILLPKHLDVYIKSDIASAEIKGHYKQLIAELINGNCNLQTTANYTKINTVNGTINALINHSKIKAFTKYGNSTIKVNNSDSNTVFLESLNGDIIIQKQ